MSDKHKNVEEIKEIQESWLRRRKKLFTLLKDNSLVSYCDTSNHYRSDSFTEINDLDMEFEENLEVDPEEDPKEDLEEKPEEESKPYIMVHPQTSVVDGQAININEVAQVMLQALAANLVYQPTRLRDEIANVIEKFI
ncbi:hypothetical protein FNV43_RR27019 [Rhamnella rubrinervis]|uniref:Uncharacterized protein n=1 Tax=Rhamnella rubrinervis TaxID=2594499 RepID=A0A8K0GS46_9ROSA|nr:hypothetical protein FNV43_RR27019 [Rhamnella rubrinervis]